MPASSPSDRADRRVVAVLRAWAKVGVTSAETVRAFRLDVVDAALIRSLPLGPRRGPRYQAGLLIPTFDPGEPEKIVGLVRVQDGQRRHGFLGNPAGIAGPASISTAERVVLTDAPLLALRLHQAGIQHVALVEEPAVLRPLAAWLRQRMVVLASYRHGGTRAMLAELPPDRRSETAKVVLPAFEGGSEVLAELGVDPQQLLDRSRRTVSRISVATAKRICAAAHKRLRRFGGDYERRAFGADFHNMGYCFLAGETGNLQRVFLRGDRRLLAERGCADALVLPARDAAKRVVGMICVPMRQDAAPIIFSELATGIVASNPCWDRPKVVDVLPLDHMFWLGDFTSGATWIVRGVLDIRVNAAMARAIGIRSVIVHSRTPEAALAAFRAMGIAAQAGVARASEHRPFEQITVRGMYRSPRRRS